MMTVCSQAFAATGKTFGCEVMAIYHTQTNKTITQILEFIIMTGNIWLKNKKRPKKNKTPKKQKTKKQQTKKDVTTSNETRWVRSCGQNLSLGVGVDAVHGGT